MADASTVAYAVAPPKKLPPVLVSTPNCTRPPVLAMSRYWSAVEAPVRENRSPLDAELICPPNQAAPALPNPPALTKEPVVVDVLAVVPNTLSPPVPEMSVVPPMRTLPSAGCNEIEEPVEPETRRA